MGAMSKETRMHTFETPAPVRLRVEIPKGRIRVVAEETGETRVRLTAIHGDALAEAMIADAEIGQTGDEIVVRVRKSGMTLFGIGGAIEAEVHAPLGSAASLSTGSGHIDTTGRLGALTASSGSGAIRLDDSAEVRAETGSGDIVIASSSGSVVAKTGSGRIAVGRVGHNARISTGSGHAELEEAVGDATLTTGSGDIEIGQAGDSLEAFAASGNVKVRRADHGRVRAKTISGKVSVGVAGGVPALLDITTFSGRVHSDLEPGGAPAEGEKHVELILSSMSGNVNVARA
jgi:DUF4097 and DUF4098 domain-containing protein YvlB